MKMGRWEEAETDLQDALKKDDKDPEALANLVACLLHRGKPHERHLKQLRMQARLLSNLVLSSSHFHKLSTWTPEAAAHAGGLLCLL